MKTRLFKRLISLVTLVAFVATSVPASYAQSVVLMPAPGVMVQPSAAFVPARLTGMRVDPQQPLRFDFIVDTGSASLTGEALEPEVIKIVRYFLASLTTPEKDLWVNLSPYEGDRIIVESFGETEMGRDLLAQDYILKQITSSLLYPESVTGKAFWAQIYKKVYAQYGTTDIPVDTFNKVWITPDEATVYVNGNTALIKSSHLKVMLEADYLAQEKAQGTGRTAREDDPARDLAKQVLREIAIPILEKEVNEGANFAQLRQVYHAMVLATWFKRNLKESLVGRTYTDQNKVKGIDLVEKGVKDEIWQQYVAAFKKGVFNYIKEETEEMSGELIPRKYFSGGFADRAEAVHEVDASQGEMASAVDAAHAVVATVDLRSFGAAAKRFGEKEAAEVEDQALTRTTAFSKADFSMLSAFKGLLGNAMGTQAGVSKDVGDAIGIDQARLSAILSENGKYYGLVWNSDGAKLFRNIFASYLTERHAEVVQGRWGAFPSLSGLFAELSSVAPEAAFSHISQWMLKEFSRLAGQPGEIAALTVDATRFVQVMLRGEVQGKESVMYDKNRRSMVELLKNDGWNCQAISDLTAVLMGLWGVEGVSVVSVVQSPDGQRYPDAQGIGHAANLVRVGRVVAYLDQGAPAEYSNAIVKVIRNNREEEVSLSELSGMPEAHGLTIDRVYKLLQAQNEYNVIRAKLGAVPGISLKDKLLTISLTTQNSSGMIRPLSEARQALESLAARAVSAQDRTPVVGLDAVFENNVRGDIRLMSEMLQSANEFSSAHQAATTGNETYQYFIDKCVALKLLTVQGDQVSFQVTGANASLYLQHVPVVIEELRDKRRAVTDSGFQTNSQMLIDLLTQALDSARKTNQQVAQSDTVLGRLRQVQDTSTRLGQTAADFFKGEKYGAAAEAYQSLADHLEQAKRTFLSGDLEGAKITLGGRPLTQQVFLDQLKSEQTQALDNRARARSNEKIAHNNTLVPELNALVMSFNKFANDTNRSVRRSELLKVVSRVDTLQSRVASPLTDPQLAGQFSNIRAQAQRVADSAQTDASQVDFVKQIAVGVADGVGHFGGAYYEGVIGSNLYAVGKAYSVLILSTLAVALSMAGRVSDLVMDRAVNQEQDFAPQETVQLSENAVLAIQETSAAVEGIKDNLGGIDLNSDNLRLQETGDKMSFTPTADAAALSGTIEGFVPVVLGIVPLVDPQAFFAGVKGGGR